MTYQTASNWQDSANINHTPRSLQTILSISQTPLPPYKMHFETIILLFLLCYLKVSLNKILMFSFLISKLSDVGL